MSVVYLQEERITAKRTTEPPRFYSATGYGSKIPTSYMLQLDGKRWYRVYCVCFSNCGSLYVRTKAGDLYLGTIDPRDD